jgi:hypothetical protein
MFVWISQDLGRGASQPARGRQNASKMITSHTPCLSVDYVNSLNQNMAIKPYLHPSVHEGVTPPGGLPEMVEGKVQCRTSGTGRFGWALT